MPLSVPAPTPASARLLQRRANAMRGEVPDGGLQNAVAIAPRVGTQIRLFLLPDIGIHDIGIHAALTAADCIDRIWRQASIWRQEKWRKSPRFFLKRSGRLRAIRN